MGNRMIQDRFQHSSEVVHWHMATVVTLLATVMTADIIKSADPTFRNVPSHIRNSKRYWPHFKVLCEIGILTWFYSIYLYDHTMYFISHCIFVAMVRVTLVRLMGFTSLWSYQLMSNTHIEEGKGSKQQIACAHVILTWNSHLCVLDRKG